MNRADRRRRNSALAGFALPGAASPSAGRRNPATGPAWLACAAALALAGCGGGGGGGSTTPTPPPVADSMPSFGTATVADRTYTQDQVIEPEVLPAATGGDGALTYSLTPELPAGLTFDAATRVLSGMPTAAQAARTYTYRVTDSDAANPDSATLSFSIAVEEPEAPLVSIAAGATSIDEWKDATGVDITVTLDAAASAPTTVELRASGTATVWGDYDLAVTGGDDDTAVGISSDGTLTLTVPANMTTATARLTPIRDLDEEGDETATITAVGGREPQAGAPSVDIAINDTGRPMLAEVTPGEVVVLFGQLGIGATAAEVRIEAQLYNEGTVASAATSGWLEARTSPDSSAGAVRARPEQVSIGALEPNGDPWEGSFTIPLASLAPSQNYYLALVVPRDSREPEDPDNPQDANMNRAPGDFHVDANGQVRATCTGLGGAIAPIERDPLFVDQWHLQNTGQTAHAQSGGVAGEDLHMASVLADGPTGEGVTVAVIDSGLEICHPDLMSNVESGLSWNFTAGQWHGARRDDPFLPSLLEGDHGTSVAGVIAMARGNGTGGRGVAPRAGLRGFNLLALGAYPHLGGEYDIDARELDALGMSTANPSAADVDIFNMSYGAAEGATKLGTDKRNAFRAGVERLRTNGGATDPLGAIYVLAAGNAFEDCAAGPNLADEKQRALFLNGELGCMGANLDPESAWPYVINVGAFNADGKRSSYASVGASLWVVAPGGEDAFEKPAIVSTDQQGRDRGYATDRELEDLPGTAPNNSGGDYTYAFGGTSAAAPNASGATAVLLSAQPALTWRDVKHIYAKTARRLDPDIRRTRVAFGGKPAVLQHAWIENAAGYGFHNHYGFGAIDLDDAVAMARSMTPDRLGAFVQHDAPVQSASAQIPDLDGEGVTLTQSVTGLPNGANIEAVQVKFQITHPKPHDLGIALTSPSRTPSVVNPVFNEALSDRPTESLDWELLTNAFYGEPPNGEWKLTVIDAASGNTGQVDSWALTIFYGDHPEE